MKFSKKAKIIFTGFILGIAMWAISVFLFPAGFPGDVLRFLWEANPILFISCFLLKSGKCYGLGLDGGPLEWAEWVWFWCLPVIYGGLGITSIFIIDRLKFRK